MNIIYIYIYCPEIMDIYIPRTQLTSFFGGEPSTLQVESSNICAIWVLGIHSKDVTILVVTVTGWG